jgi:uncharacterized membrane protein YjdF
MQVKQSPRHAARIVAAVALGISPYYRWGWLMENVLVLGLRWLRFSSASHAALTGFSLHEAPGFARNHFDRTIHFAYGLRVPRQW